MTNMQITLAHPTPAPFVQQVARALLEADMLRKFSTTLVTDPEAIWVELINPLAKTMGINLSRQLSRRSLTEVPKSLVSSHPWQEIIRIIVSSIDNDKRLTDVVFHWANNGFDRWVSQNQLHQTQGVYSYEYNSLEIFRESEKKGIARIYDVPSPEHDYVENLLEAESERFPEIDSPYRRYCRKRQSERTEHRRQERQLADLIIANSSFTKQSYVAAGCPDEKIRVVPCGAPPVCEAASQEDKKETLSHTSFLWAGTFSIRKGAHYLLQAWQKLNPGRAAKLQVLGAMGLPDSLLKSLPDSISFSGTVPRSELYPIYQRSDALVFPTLCDGFGMVVTEAFAHGLPVITTDRAGAADLVDHGVNGLIVPAGDADALTDALDWCISHPNELKAMKQAALKTASEWQWKDYRAALVLNIEEGLHRAGYTAKSYNQAI